MHSSLSQILAPVMLQIVASHMAKDKTPQSEMAAFNATIVGINLPMAMVALVYRAAGSAFFLSAETRATSSTILQMLYYYAYATESWHTQQKMVLMAAFFTWFMNEITVSGGDWFGHRVVSVMNIFFCIRVLVGLVESKIGDRVMPVWNAIVLSEFASMSALCLSAIWDFSLSTPWFVFAFMLVIAITFPTSNRNVPPSKAHNGFLAVAPVCVDLS